VAGEIFISLVQRRSIPQWVAAAWLFQREFEKVLGRMVSTWHITNFPYFNGYDEDPVDLKENKCLNSDRYFLA
jgi:hypothetical protein